MRRPHHQLRPSGSDSPDSKPGIVTEVENKGRVLFSGISMEFLPDRDQYAVTISSRWICVQQQKSLSKALQTEVYNGPIYPLGRYLRLTQK